MEGFMLHVAQQRWRAIAVFAIAALVGVFVLAGESPAVGSIGDGFEQGSGTTGISAEAAASLAATSHVKQVHPTGFDVIDSTDTKTLLSTNDYCMSSGGASGFAGDLITSVELPVGAVITGFSVHYWDNDAANVNAFLGRTSQAGAGTASVAQIGDGFISAGTPGFGQGTVVVSEAVDANETFFLYYRTFSGSSDTALCGFDLLYDIPSSGDNLLFTALDAPCKVFDTFTAPPGVFAGPVGPDDGLLTPVIAAPSAGEVTSQGGDAGCAETAIPADAVAVSINFTTRNISQKGNIRTAASGAATKPVVNFSDTAVMNNSNEVTVLLSGGAIDFEIGGQASGDDTLNVSGVVFGYYTPLPNLGN